MITRVSPIKLKLLLSKEEEKTVKNFLTFTNKTAQQAVKRFSKGRWFLNANGAEAFYAELARLNSEVQQCLLLTENNELQAYSGLEAQLEKLLKTTSVNEVVYPDSKLLAWNNAPAFKMHYYQEESLKRLLEKRHAGVEICTGGGKSYIILHLIKELGLPTVVMAPSSSIAEQLYDSFVYHFGAKRVGKCYGGKKEYKKLITVALPQTLTKIDDKSDCYKKLSKTQVFISDESHLNAAKTLAEVCFGMMANAPYRFFFSATQMRNDGQDLLLNAITGPIVYEMTVREGVDQGFLSKPIFKMVSVESDTECTSQEPNDLTRHHLYYNPNVIKKAAFLANSFVKHLDHKVLILIDEVAQFTKLLPYLEHEVGFAHGPLGENKKNVPELYWDSEPHDLVKKFNNNELPILVGTSCISMGTDIKTVKTLIYLQGGKSEIQIRQAVGRATRKSPGKTECNIIDFDVVNNEVTHKHAEARREIYEAIYPPIEEIQF